MQIGIAAPACLALATVRGLEGSGPALLGVTLQHPPIGLAARAAQHLVVTGARANVASGYAADYLRAQALPPQGEIEIEMAIPRAMGLSSEPMLALSVVRALAALHGLPGTPEALVGALQLHPCHSLAAQSFATGGLLLVEPGTQAGHMPRLARRAEVAHPEAQAWAFVFVLPRAPAELTDERENERAEALRAAAAGVSAESAQVLDEQLWPALARDDIAQFGAALTRLQELTREALAAQGVPTALDEHERATLDIMRGHGAVAYGRAPTGLGLYGLLRGAQPSRVLRRALLAHEGIRGGAILATIVDNGGVWVRGPGSQAR
jgi:predicted sugar kinase